MRRVNFVNTKYYFISHYMYYQNANAWFLKLVHKNWKYNVRIYKNKQNTYKMRLDFLFNPDLKKDWG